MCVAKATWVMGSLFASEVGGRLGFVFVPGPSVMDCLDVGTSASEYTDCIFQSCDVANKTLKSNIVGSNCGLHWCRHC